MLAELYDDVLSAPALPVHGNISVTIPKPPVTAPVVSPKTAPVAAPVLAPVVTAKAPVAAPVTVAPVVAQPAYDDLLSSPSGLVHSTLVLGPVYSVSAPTTPGAAPAAKQIVPAPVIQPATAPFGVVNDEHIQGTASLEGGQNSPPVTAGANEPGLNSSVTEGITTMKKHWLWILAILLAIIGIWYYNPGNILGRTAAA